MARRCLYLAFEESPQQLMRNLRGIGIDLEPYVKKVLCGCIPRAPRCTAWSSTWCRCTRWSPSSSRRRCSSTVSNFISTSTAVETQAMLLRLVDFLKEKQITALFTHLTSGGSARPPTCLVDTWLLVRNIEIDDARTRGLYVLKSRGMPHSHEIREFVLTPKGIELKQFAGKAGKGKTEMIPANGTAGEKWNLRLYTAGQSPKSLAALDNEARMRGAPGRYSIEVVDLLKNPRLAKDDQIVAIPTLVRKLPEPLRRIVGDLSDTERTLVGLQLRQIKCRRNKHGTGLRRLRRTRRCCARSWRKPRTYAAPSRTARSTPSSSARKAAAACCWPTPISATGSWSSACKGAVTATANGHILFANQRFSDMIGVPLAQLYTAPLESYVGVSDRARLSAFLMVSGARVAGRGRALPARRLHDPLCACRWLRSPTAMPRCWSPTCGRCGGPPGWTPWTPSAARSKL